MHRRSLVLLLAVVGILVAASIGYAAYLASRDSVGLPVTKLQTTPRGLAPAKTRTGRRPRPTTETTSGTTTVDDHGGGSGGDSGSGGGSGRGSGGGHGGDD
jgi:hypothetical protein